MAALPSQLKALTRLRCAVFQTSYNPTSMRTGAKYLRSRLRGPSMVKYYPPVIDFARLARQYPELELVDEDEEQRLQDIEDKKKRGKGVPKKAKTKAVVLVLRASHSLIHSHLRRGNHSQPILPSPATSSIREATAPSRTQGGCVRGRLVRGLSYPLSLPSRSSMTAFARTFARAIVHAGLLTATHNMGNNQPNIINFRNWTLTTIYILMTTTHESVTSIVYDAVLTTDPIEWTISIDVERQLRHIQLPEPLHLPRRLARSLDVPSMQGFPLLPRRCQTAP
ncbi:hypothetical protein C0995_012291 [Termitomyces sp. Mi166|nr:hypothetical protein C0995_012291 [Termitomyces sp. Mi166\